MKIVEEAIRNWENERAGMIAELESIPEEHFDFRPAEGARSVRELAVHIAEAGLMLAAEILRTDGSFLRFFEPRGEQTRPAARSKAEILDLLRTSGAETATRLRNAGESLATRDIQTFHGEESALTALWFAVGHEMYHGGQLASYARGRAGARAHAEAPGDARRSGARLTDLIRGGDARSARRAGRGALVSCQRSPRPAENRPCPHELGRTRGSTRGSGACDH